MKKIIALTAALLLLVLLAGCAEAGREETSFDPEGSAQESVPAKNDPETTTTAATAQQSPSPTAAQQEPSPAVGQGEQAPDFSIDASACSAWQRAYLSLLQDLCDREAPFRPSDKSEMFSGGLSESYGLYDIDKDGIPEMFIKYGDCEAAYYTEVYTYRNESAVYLDGFSSGHSVLYTWPGQNAVLFYRAHMGYAEMFRAGLADGKLAFEKLFTEDISDAPEVEYTAPGDVVAGSSYINTYWTVLSFPEYAPLTLPVFEYDPAASPAVLHDSADGGAIRAVLAGNQKLYGVSGDGFGGDTGWMTFEDYCQPGAANRYANGPVQIKKSGWLDFDKDGCEECIFLLGEPEGGNGSGDQYIVLSEQEGVVYAYCLNYIGNGEVNRDGVFADDLGWPYGIVFYKNQCYTYTTAYDPNTPSITWEA